MGHAQKGAPLDDCCGVYTEGMDENAQRELAMLYIEEIFADQYAGMNRSSIGARQAVETAGDVAQRFAGDIENARQNRAGIERRNGPVTRLAFADAHIPTYEELVQKGPVKIVDLSSAEMGKRYADQRRDFKVNARKTGFYSEPIVNKDTNQLCFVVPATITHTYSNKGANQLGAAKAIKELVAEAVLTHGEADKHNIATGVYTLFAAARENGEILPVKIKVKEFDVGDTRLQQYIQDYFISHGAESSYATVYDGKVLVVEEIKNEEASSSMAATAEYAAHNQPSASSTINIAELLDLVKGDARKYIPKPCRCYNDS